MNKTINKLTTELNEVNDNYANKREKIKQKLQVAYNKLFDHDIELTKALLNLESASEYGADAEGIYRWFRFSGLYDIPEAAREFFETYIQDNHYATVDWTNSCFMTYEGDAITIQDDSRHRSDNGVWFNHKQIFKESDYINEENEVDETKRNALIETYMENTGYFPGVFRIDQHGNVFYVNTKA